MTNYKAIIDQIKDTKKLTEYLGRSRELSLVQTKLDEAILWLKQAEENDPEAAKES